MILLMSGKSLLLSLLLSYYPATLLAMEESRVPMLQDRGQEVKGLPEYPGVYEEEMAINNGGGGLRESDNAGKHGWVKNGPFSGILSLIIGEILKTREVAESAKIPVSEWNRQQKKTGENFIRFGRKRRASWLTPTDPEQRQYYNVPFPMSGPKLTRWDHGQDCPEEDGQQPWIMMSGGPFKDDRKEDAPGDDTFIRFGKGSYPDSNPTTDQGSSTTAKKVRGTVKCKLQHSAK